MPHTIPQLDALTTSLAIAAGVPEPAAKILAESLVDADAHGTHTHGLSRLSIYLERIAKGLIDPKAALTLEHQQGSVLTLDANNGLGQIQAVRALELLYPIARTNGVATATLRRSQHFGALSYYTNLAAAKGFILLAMTNCEPAMAPTGGYEPFFGTNPIAAAFPTAGTPVSIDMATSIVARGNIIAASKQGKPIPEGWALTAEGLPTTDPAEALKGTVATMAAHKGYALAMMVEVFSSVLSGAAIGDQIGSMYKDLDSPQNVGHFFCLFDTEAFLPRAKYDDRMASMITRLKQNKRQLGIEEILIPGERSARKQQTSHIQGITLSPETIADLQKWCTQYNIQFPASNEDSATSCSPSS